VLSAANVVAVGCNTASERGILGTEVGPAEDVAFWAAFLRSLVKRELKGVQLVISDAHTGLKAAIVKALHRATWQRCRAHFMRTLLVLVPKGAQDAVTALVRTISISPTTRRWPSSTTSPACSAELLEEAAENVLAHLQLPKWHRWRLDSTNRVEQLHIGAEAPDSGRWNLPQPSVLLRMVGTLLAEQDDSRTS